MIDTEQKYIQKLSIQSLYWCWIDVLCRTRINVLWCFVDVFSTFTIDVQMKFLHYNFRRLQSQRTELKVQIKGLLHAAKATGRIWTSIVLCRWHCLCRKMILQLLRIFFTRSNSRYENQGSCFSAAASLCLYIRGVSSITQVVRFWGEACVNEMPKLWHVDMIVFSDLSWKTVLCFSEPSLFWSCSSSVRSEEHEDRWGNHLQFAGFLAARRLQKCPTLSTELRQLQGRQSRGDGRMESLFWNLLCFLLLLIIVLPMSWSWESWIVIIWNDLLSWTRLLESPRQREDVYETKPKLRRVNLEQDGGDYWRRRRQASWLKVLHGEKEGGRQRQ